MDLQTLKTLSDYNRQVNNELGNILVKMNYDQWAKEFDGYFSSIKSLVNHLYICDYHWLKRFSNLREFEYIKDNVFFQEITFDKNAFNEVNEYIEKRKNLDTVIKKCVEEISESDLLQNLKYIDSHGIEYYKNFGVLLLHFFNHQTHHRGMITLYLEMMQININNDFSNLAYIVRES